MNRFSKALSASAVLALTVAPVMAQAADVRPSDARMTVSSSAVPSNVRAGAAVGSEQSDMFGMGWLIALLAAIAAAAGIAAAASGDESP